MQIRLLGPSPAVIDERLTIQLHAAEGVALLHLRPDGWDARVGVQSAAQAVYALGLGREDRAQP